MTVKTVFELQQNYTWSQLALVAYTWNECAQFIDCSLWLFYSFRFWNLGLCTVCFFFLLVPHGLSLSITVGHAPRLFSLYKTAHKSILINFNFVRPKSIHKTEIINYGRAIEDKNKIHEIIKERGRNRINLVNVFNMYEYIKKRSQLMAWNM